MSAIRSEGTTLENRMLELLRHVGFEPEGRWADELPGKPDFVWPSVKVALFVHSCFWHGCPEHCRRPKSRQEYWDDKIAANRARDRKVASELRAAGWHVVAIWEHELRATEVTSTAKRLRRRLRRLLARPAQRP